MKKITVHVLGYNLDTIKAQDGCILINICNLGAEQGTPSAISPLAYRKVTIYNCITGHRPSPQAIANRGSDCLKVDGKYYLDIEKVDGMLRDLVNSPQVGEDHKHRAQFLLDKGFVDEIQKQVEAIAL